MLYFSLFFVLPLCFGSFQPKCGPQIDVDEYFKVNYDDDEFYFHVPPALPPKTSEIQKDLEDCGKNEQGNCEIGWKSFNRPTGEWCIKIFYENRITQPNAQKKCQEIGATLSGLQNQLESFWVTLTASTKISPSTGSLWVGLKRRPDCIRKKADLTNCTIFNMFEWTDGSVQGTDGILWQCGNPDNGRSGHRNQECASLTLSSSGYGYKNTYQAGTLDDVECDFDFVKAKQEWRDVKGYICGKKAKV